MFDGVKSMKWIVLLFLSLCGGCSSLHHDKSGLSLQRFEFQKPEMGLPFRIVLYAADEQKANEAVAAAFRRIEEINDRMSDYEEDSELSQLSRSAGQRKQVQVSEDLWKVIERGQRLAEETDGAFDITVGPVIQLWRKARREKQLPAPALIQSARAKSGYRNLKLDARTRSATLLEAGMKLDLGAIAKGFADDEALKVLRAHGVTRALVAGGGDMAVGDPPPGKKGWRIELAPHDAASAAVTNYVLLANCALATSGDLFQHVEIDGKRYSHIVDPRTGIGLTDHSLVIVIAPNGITADSLSTAASVLGPKAGLGIVERYRGVVRIVRAAERAPEIFESKGFHRYIEKPD